MINSYKNQTPIRFYKTIDVISPSSKSFVTHDNISFLSKSEFSLIFYSFSKNISILGLPKIEDTEMLLQFIDIVCKKTKKNLFNSFDDLSSQGINGYFNLVLEQILFNKKMQTFTVGDIDYYINSGVFILNKAFSLFHNNSNLTIGGFILDTTWWAIPNYVTSILNVCFRNSSLPVAFAFGGGETIYLYDLLLQTVQDHLNIEFEGKYLESDEGSALHSICDKYSMIQLSCLRHFLEKLKKLDYFYEVKQLLKYICQVDFENCLQIFSDQFTTICIENPEEINKINKILIKVGLFFSDGQITIQNLNKWKKVSLLGRVDVCMPRTTNTLESMHGHINESCPRRNTFFFVYIYVNLRNGN